jgi:hypothetical protein
MLGNLDNAEEMWSKAESLKVLDYSGVDRIKDKLASKSYKMDWQIERHFCKLECNSFSQTFYLSP